MSDHFPVVVFDSGQEAHPDAVVRSECGNWVSCIFNGYVERYPRRRVKEIVEEVGHGPE
jgi:hypothetical protein